jgi:hypothetical protein
VDRADELLAGTVVADGPPHGLDAAGQRRLAHEPVAPDGVEDLLLGHDPVALADQQGEHVEHLGLDRSFGARPAEQVPRQVQLALAKRMDHVRASFARSSLAPGISR